LSNENCHVTPGGQGGSKPVSPNDTWGRGAKIGQKMSSII